MDYLPYRCTNQTLTFLLHQHAFVLYALEIFDAKHWNTNKRSNNSVYFICDLFFKPSITFIFLKSMKSDRIYINKWSNDSVYFKYNLFFKPSITFIFLKSMKSDRIYINKWSNDSVYFKYNLFFKPSITFISV